MKKPPKTSKSGQSIKSQLVSIQMITCLIALVATGAIFGRISYKKNRSCAVRYLESQTALLACKAESALKENSQKDAIKILETLRTQQSISSACVYDSNGYVFASYLPNGKTHSHYIAPSPTKKVESYDHYIHAYCPVKLDNKIIGSVCIEDDLNSINCIVRQNIVALISVLAGTFLLSILIALRLQSSISKPILEITRKILHISRSSDFSLRLPCNGNKETQMLSNALNDMLKSIQNKIRNTNDQLSHVSKENREVNSNKDQLEVNIATRKDEITRANEDLYKEKHEHEQSEQMLRKTLIKLETTNKELERFAKISAHDLQEPIRKIRAFADRIIESSPKDSNESSTNYPLLILKSATQMQFMINDLMAFSTLGRKRPIFRSLSLNAIIDQVLKDLHNEINESQAKIIVGILPNIDAENHLIQQLFRHLILNSINFRQLKKVPTIEILSNDNDDKTITVSVTDNGIGFDQKYANKIFDIFQCLDHHNHQGTGVGLAICKRIVAVHGGTIRVESKAKKGSIFFITLPSEHKYEREL